MRNRLQRVDVEEEKQIKGGSEKKGKDGYPLEKRDNLSLSAARLRAKDGYKRPKTPPKS